MGLSGRKSEQYFPPRQLLTDKGLIDNPEYIEWSRKQKNRTSPTRNKPVDREPNAADRVATYLIIAGEVVWILAKVLLMIISVLILLFTGLRLDGGRR